MKIIRVIHDMWCVLTQRCDVDVIRRYEDRHIRWMREQEVSAVRNTEALHQRHNAVAEQFPRRKESI